MLTYIQVHLYYVIPPILVLAAIYRPLFGRRDAVKIGWLMFMATIYTTPWDNFIIASNGWGYPPNSILFKIWNVPFEEHLFFILQPLFLVLLHSIVTLPHLIPFDIAAILKGIGISADSYYDNTPGISDELDEEDEVGNCDEQGDSDEEDEYETVLKRGDDMKDRGSRGQPDERFGEDDRLVKVKTLRRRPLPALLWVGIFFLGLALVLDAHGITPVVFKPLCSALGFCQGRHGFYLGWILVWISPVIAGLTWLGAEGFGTRGDKLAWGMGAGWLCVVDTIAIRSGAWFVSPETSLGLEAWCGLPIEEFLFFLLTSHLVILSTSLISHIHTLLILCPNLPPCPPINPAHHILLLARVAFDPPAVDVTTLLGLLEAEKILRKGSQSFDVAKLAFGREMRIGLVAVYAWARVTDNLIDVPPQSSVTNHRSRPLDKNIENQARFDVMHRIVRHIDATFQGRGKGAQFYLNEILDGIPNLSNSDRAAFTLFSNLISRLVPRGPFIELTCGYRMDMQFIPTPETLKKKLMDDSFDPEYHLPIATTGDLELYSERVASSIASAICLLSWSILTTSLNPSFATAPMKNVEWGGKIAKSRTAVSGREKMNLLVMQSRMDITFSARKMGIALQYVNISRDVLKDARIGRIYIPIDRFESASEILDILLPSSGKPKLSLKKYTIPLLDEADSLRRDHEEAIEKLPRTVRSGMRAMIASYFEIAEEIRRRDGEVEVDGLKVDGRRRALAAASAIWFGGYKKGR